MGVKRGTINPKTSKIMMYAIQFMFYLAYLFLPCIGLGTDDKRSIFNEFTTSFDVLTGLKEITESSKLMENRNFSAYATGLTMMSIVIIATVLIMVAGSIFAIYQIVQTAKHDIKPFKSGIMALTHVLILVCFVSTQLIIPSIFTYELYPFYAPGFSHNSGITSVMMFGLFAIGATIVSALGNTLIKIDSKKYNQQN